MILAPRVGDTCWQVFPDLAGVMAWTTTLAVTRGSVGGLLWLDAQLALGLPVEPAVRAQGRARLESPESTVARRRWRSSPSEAMSSCPRATARSASSATLVTSASIAG